MNKNVIYKKLISYFKEEDNIILNEADIDIMLKEGCFKDLNDLESWVLDHDNVKVFKSMSDLLSWQFDCFQSVSNGFDALLSYTVDEVIEFSKIFNGSATLADYYHYKNKDSQRIYLTDGKAAYIYG